jgi:hypothetical protein
MRRMMKTTRMPSNENNGRRHLGSQGNDPDRLKSEDVGHCELTQRETVGKNRAGNTIAPRG